MAVFSFIELCLHIFIMFSIYIKNPGLMLVYLLLKGFLLCLYLGFIAYFMYMGFETKVILFVPWIVFFLTWICILSLYDEVKAGVEEEEEEVRQDMVYRMSYQRSLAGTNVSRHEF